MILPLPFADEDRRRNSELLLPDRRLRRPFDDYAAGAVALLAGGYSLQPTLAAAPIAPDLRRFLA